MACGSKNDDVVAVPTIEAEAPRRTRCAGFQSIIAGPARQGHGRCTADQRVGECGSDQMLEAAERIHPRAAGVLLRCYAKVHRDAGARGFVGERVLACAAVQDVVGGIADYDVVARTSDGILNHDTAGDTEVADASSDI